MGKQPPPCHQHQCGDDAPICGCNLSDVKYDCTPTPCDDHTKLSEEENIHDLLVVGAGPHALLLRLLSPEPDFLSEKERHKQAEFKERMRPPRDVNAYLRELSRGPKAISNHRGKIRRKVHCLIQHRHRHHHWHSRRFINLFSLLTNMVLGWKVGRITSVH